MKVAAIILTVIAALFCFASVAVPIVALAVHAADPLPRHQSTAAWGITFVCVCAAFGLTIVAIEAWGKVTEQKRRRQW